VSYALKIGDFDCDVEVATVGDGIDETQVRQVTITGATSGRRSIIQMLVDDMKSGNWTDEDLVSAATSGLEGVLK
jgi:hypothetical protein